MVGALNKLPVTLSGLLFFASERAAVNVGYVLSIVVSFASGLVYSYSQVLKKRQLLAKETEALPMESRASVVSLEKRRTFESITGLDKSQSQEMIPLQQTNK